MKREAKQSETSAFRAEKGFIARAMQGDAWLLPLSPSGSLKGFSKAFIKKKNFYLLNFGCAGLGCRMGFFSCCSARASHCSGFSCYRAQALGGESFSSRVMVGSAVVTPRLWKTGPRACSAACGIFLAQGSTHVPCIGRWIL